MILNPFEQQTMENFSIHIFLRVRTRRSLLHAHVVVLNELRKQQRHFCSSVAVVLLTVT